MTQPNAHSLNRIAALLAALALPTLSCLAQPDLIVHEWGTFTSIQSREGQSLLWNGVDTDELPEFVHNWSRPGLNRVGANPFGPFALLSKQAYSGLQRMETPVIYFYASRGARVDVSVEFPQGYITEWFPQASVIGPSYRSSSSQLALIDQAQPHSASDNTPPTAGRPDDQRITNRIVQWNGVEVLPSFATGANAAQPLAPDADNHYFAARATDANPLRIDVLDPATPGPETEKFLFYRGVGDFEAPLQIRMEGPNVTVINRGHQALRHLFVISIGTDTIRFAHLDRLEPSATGVFGEYQTGNRSDALDRLSADVIHALTSEGLYARESAAMVATWREAWFGEPGTRVLYCLPRHWTDEVLPLDIDPVPASLVRVMVGRAEIITPDAEEEIRQCVLQFQQGDEAERSNAADRFAAAGLGRFSQPAMELVIRRSGDEAFEKAAKGLLQAVLRQQQNRSPGETETAQGSAGRVASDRG